MLSLSVGQIQPARTVFPDLLDAAQGFFRRRVARGLFERPFRPFRHTRCNVEITCRAATVSIFKCLFLAGVRTGKVFWQKVAQTLRQNDEHAKKGKSAGSDGDPLHFVERDFITGAVVKPRGIRARMGRHQLRVFERAAVLAKVRNPRRTEGVAANLRLQLAGPPLYHAIGVRPMHRLVGEHARPADGRTKRGDLPASPMPAASI